MQDFFINYEGQILISMIFYEILSLVRDIFPFHDKNIYNLFEFLKERRVSKYSLSILNHYLKKQAALNFISLIK